MEIVWVVSERCWADVITRGVGYCYVSFFKDGFYYEEMVEADDITEPEDMGIHYEYQKESDGV